MDWAREGATWPHHAASRFVQSRPHRWHVQEMGAGPVVLLLHGTGGTTHSWREIMPALAAEFRVIAPDLPGHGFTRMGTRGRSGLGPMAADLARLVATLGAPPAAIIGHSAGAALALRMVRMLPGPPRAIVGINAALENFSGAAAFLFPALARGLALNPFAAPAFARLGAAVGNIRAMIGATGSTLPPEGFALYRRLLADPAHVDGALTMMAQWSLGGLQADLPRIEVPCLLITGAADQAVSPAVSEAAAARLPQGAAQSLPGLGQPAHEEDPQAVLAALLPFLRRHLPAST